MLKLSPEKLKALSERLQDRGAPASKVRPIVEGQDPVAEMLLAEYGPMCEVMFLAMSADGQIDQAEKDVIRGALRELDDRIRTTHFDAMLERAAKLLAEEGPSERLRAVAKDMADDPIRGEVSYVLAAAIAYADNDVSMDENSFLNDLADAFGIDESRSEQLQRLLL